MTYRCTVCFSREIDVVLFRDDDGYYCVKCSFVGSAQDIEGMYADVRKKFRLIGERLPFPGSEPE